MNEVKEKIKIKSTFEYKLIYVMTIYDTLHQGVLKVGEATINTNKNAFDIEDNCDELNNAAKKRIREYTNTIGVQENLLYTTVAVKADGEDFSDKDVHNVLENSGIKKHKFNNEKNPMEWFETNLETTINAINAVKNGELSLTPNKVVENNNPIVLRQEQLDAINKTIKHFKSGDKMLWNAKMRFGKTLSALEVIKRSQYKKTIIITHRPVVNDGWYDDFKKIFSDSDNYLYGSRKKMSIKALLDSGKSFVYFASIQDLRESSAVEGKYEKNDLVFETDWDLVVVDEAHEGTQTLLGNKVLNEIIKSKDEKNTKVLFLSGTPFNVIDEFEDDEIFTWDYVMEQQAKIHWEEKHGLEHNPYLELPRMNILTYDLNKMLPEYIEVADSAFNFKEFFRVWTGDTSVDGREMPNNKKIGDFIHEEDVMKFLNLMCKKSENSNYPFSKDEFIENFRHTFWIVPGVKEAKALTKMLRNHPNYQMFKIVNVAGTGDENGYEALDAVRNAIGKNPEDTYTITISCGRLTTGVTVKEWTAVFYLAGSYSTSASSYLQTIFRVQSPATIAGKIKTDCYVFDFAPDRTLKILAKVGDLSIKAGAINTRERMKEFLNYCPVIAVNGSTMEKYDVNTMLQQLKRAYAEQVADHGFDDTNIYNDELLNLDPNAIEKLKELEGILGKTKQTQRIREIDINLQGFNDEINESVSNNQNKELSEEQIQIQKEREEKNKQRRNAISILRGISIRIPLLIYGAEIADDQDITPDNFVDLIDDSSWEEFMPKGVTKEHFNEIKEYYDREIFIGAGKRIRNIAKYADDFPPLERTKKIAELFSSFRNPDKETVLTPWIIVNRHMGDTLGGYSFFDEDYENTLEEPRFINNGEVTSETLSNTNSHILEINSKTGLYPLYLTFSLFKQRCLNTDAKKLDDDMMNKLWKQTLSDNIFVVCNTPMACKITRRTLAGYKQIDINICEMPNMADKFKNDFEEVYNKIHNPNTWNKEGDIMKFDAIVGNPPYQENISNSKDNSSLSKQLFPSFVEGAIKLNPTYVSLITPSRWFAGDAQDKSFVKLREYLKIHNSIVKIYHYPNEKDLFSNVEIKGGINYFLYEQAYNGLVDFYICENAIKNKSTRPLFEEGLDIIIADSNTYPILLKVKNNNFISLTTITKGRNAFGIVGKEDKIAEITTSNFENGLVPIRCKENKIRYINPKLITKNVDVFKSYKVFVSKSAGNPNSDNKIIGTPYLGRKNEACTDSLIPFGCFENEEEAINLQKYLKTKFLRFMVRILKVSQNVYQNVYQFVPLQDFTNKSDIDWSKTIDEIDQQLYQKYNLNDEEIKYIEDKIKEMK